VVNAPARLVKGLTHGFIRSLTRMIRVPLTLVSHVQVLAEVTARKFGGEVARWRLVRPLLSVVLSRMRD
jgi:hypothetical protein